MASKRRILIFVLLFLCTVLSAQELDEFFRGLKFTHRTENALEETSRLYSFQGYTNRWEDFNITWQRYNNLFGMSYPGIAEEIRRANNSCRKDLGMPDLFIQEGFISNLTENEYVMLDNPATEEVKTAIMAKT